MHGPGRFPRRDPPTRPVIRLRPCPPHALSWAISGVSAHPRSAVHTTVHGYGSHGSTGCRHPVRPPQPPDGGGVPPRSLRGGLPCHATRARDAPDRRSSTTSTSPGPETRPGGPTRRGRGAREAPRGPARRSGSCRARGHTAAHDAAPRRLGCARGRPRREPEGASLDAPPQQPSQGLELPTRQPMLRLASDGHQRLIQTRRALPGSPPR